MPRSNASNTTISSAPSRRKAARILAPLALAALVLTGCAADLGGTSDSPEGALPILSQGLEDGGTALDTEEQAGQSMAETALQVLDTIPVAAKTEWDGPFQRAEYFGDGWADLDGDRCNTRQELLADNLTDVEMNRDGCRVDFGVLLDPYTGESVSFERGEGTSDDVQIDHVVALYNAWRTGAQDLTQEERLQLANDPLNLQPTVDWANDEKKSSDASQWLPPDESYHCTYVARQIVVKASYDLWVTPAEDDAMRDVLEGCL